jgi:hypothetical protein
VSPECKNYLLTSSITFDDTPQFKFTEMGDVYSFGVLLYMLVALVSDPFLITNSHVLPNQTFSLPNEILMKRNYSPLINNLLFEALHPDPEKRAAIKQLIALVELYKKNTSSTLLKPVNNKRKSLTIKDFKVFLSDRTKSVDLKFDEQYTIIKKASNSTLTSSQEIDNNVKASTVFDIVLMERFDAKEYDDIYIVESKYTMRRYNAFHKLFYNEAVASQYYKEMQNFSRKFTGKSFVSICNIFLQKNLNQQFQVYIIKVLLLLLLFLNLDF